jgi:hypothetical protein
MTAPALGLPVQDKFQFYVYEKGGLALGVVTQLSGITPQPVGYLSRVRSGSQGMARMPQSNGCSKPFSAWSSETYPKPPPSGLYPT